jgi:hypothetical protein
MNSKRTFILPVILITSLSALLTTSCKRNSLEGKLIITQISGNLPDMNLTSGESWRYIQGAHLVAVDPDKPSSMKILSGDFYAACSPEISPDGRNMLFAAQKKQGESWQIWEMDLSDLKYRRITSLGENCTDPVFLPNGWIIFSKYTVNDTVKTGYSLFSCNASGSDIKQLTFNPHANFATSVLKDGRLLTITRQLLPSVADPMLMILRPDGTKADMFYKGDKGSALITQGRETIDGKIMFVETDPGNPAKGNVISITYNRPLHSRINLTDGIEGSFNAVLPLQSGRILVSYRPDEKEPYALYELDAANKKLGRKIYGNPSFQVLDAVKVEEYERPMKLPSEVDMGVKTGLLLCQNVNITSVPIALHTSSSPKVRKIEIFGMDSTMGKVKVAKDGSVYLKILADKPFQIRTLDEHGNLLDGPCTWLWVRPNERRGCVGCHENPELAPENDVPLAVKKSPVIVPVHIDEIEEKEVELE